LNQKKIIRLKKRKKGLYGKFEVKKITNPDKKLDCIVLEFDDPIARRGIKAFSEGCRARGYIPLADDLDKKLNAYYETKERI